MDIMPVKCPHCGKDVDKFYYVGGLRAPKHIDPSCNKMVKVSEIARAKGMSEDEVREKFTTHVTKQEGRRMVAEMKRGRVSRKVEEEEEGEREEEEEEEFLSEKGAESDPGQVPKLALRRGGLDL